MDHVAITVDTSTLKRTGSGAVTGEIYWRVGASAFPGVEWTDFPVRIVAWWIVALETLSLAGGECELDFMDGPYSILVEATTSRDVVRLKFHDHDVVDVNYPTISLSELTGEVGRVAGVLLNYCNNKRWISAEIADLEQAVIRLRNFTGIGGHDT